MSFDIFALLYSLIATPVLSSVAAMNGLLAGMVAPALRWALIAFVAGSLLRTMFRPNAEPFGDFTLLLLGGAVALYMVSSSASYGTWARDVLLNGIATEIPNALAGITGARPITAAAFAEIFGKAWAAGVAVLRNLPWSVAAIGLILVVVIFWLAAAAATAIAFAIWLKGFVFLALLIGVGPLFGALWLFPWTRGWFFGWLNTVMANIVLMVLSVALLTLLLAATTELLAQIAADARGSNANEFRQGGMLLGGIILFAVSAWLTYQLPATAGAITHGFAGYAGSAASRIAAALMPNLRSSEKGGDGGRPDAERQQPGPQPYRSLMLMPPGSSLSNH